MNSTIRAGVCLAALGFSLQASAGLEGRIGNTDWNLGGFVELENTYTDQSGKDGKYTMRTNRTRIFLKTASDTTDGKIRTHIEYDFNGDNNDGDDLMPRLRHAAFFWNGWTVGQTLSAFSSMVSYHKSVDDAMPAPFTGLSSNPLDRNPQIAYGGAFGNGYKYKLSVEKPSGDDSTVRPFFAGKVSYTGDSPLAWSVAAASYEDSNSEDQWQMLLGARYTIGKLSLRLAHRYDDGIDGKSTSGSVRYNFDKKNWVSAIYERADINDVKNDRAYLNYYRQVADSIQVGFEYAQMGMASNSPERNIYRMDIKKTF